MNREIAWMYTRKTNETSIAMNLKFETLENQNWENRLVPGSCYGSTGIGFFDHMLQTLCYYSGIQLNFQSSGDFHVDQHHYLEDLGYALGTCFKMTLDASPNLQRCRFAHRYVPMDESLVRVVIDLSGRPYLNWHLPQLRDSIGQLESDCLLEFFRAFIQNAKITCHIEVIEGCNSHHIVEAIFKALALSLKDALAVTSATLGSNSTKGLID